MIWITFLPLLFASAYSFNLTVCDCSAAQNKGFLNFMDEDCDKDPLIENPVPINYFLVSNIPEVKRFPGHTCSMWVVTKTIYTNALWWETVTHSRLPLEVSEKECRRMRDVRQCRGQNMDALGLNKWSLEGIPDTQGSWLRTVTGSMINCHLEEVALESECDNCTISSPIGDIPGSKNG